MSNFDKKKIAENVFDIRKQNKYKKSIIYDLKQAYILKKHSFCGFYSEYFIYFKTNKNIFMYIYFGSKLNLKN